MCAAAARPSRELIFMMLASFGLRANSYRELRFASLQNLSWISAKRWRLQQSDVWSCVPSEMMQ